MARGLARRVWGSDLLCAPLPQLLLMERKLQEVHPLLTLCGQIVENWQGNPIQKEALRVFFLVLQVTHYLDAGQVNCLWDPLPSAPGSRCF